MTERSAWTRRAGASLAQLPDRIRLAVEGWWEHARLAREFDTLRQRGELDRTLADNGISPSDVPRLLRAHPRAAQQLAGMMRRLGINRAALPRDAKVVESLRAVEWRCGDCADWRQCRDWLASDEAPGGQHAFCPNAAALDELRCSEIAAAGRHAEES